MRAIEIFVMGTFIAILGTVAWNARAWLHPGAKNGSSASAAANAVAGASTGKKEPKKARAHDKREPVSADQTSGAGKTALPSQVVIKAELSPLPMSFPTRNDLPVGATDVQIRAHFGEPTARVTEMRGGRVFEQYYYLNRERTQLIVATLKAGVIVSAESTQPLNYDVPNARP